MTDPREPGREQGQFAILPLADGKWPGPTTQDVSVADELAFDALPEETKRLAQRVVIMRVFAGSKYSSYGEAYDDGYESGKADAEAELEDEQKKEIEDLRKRFEVASEELDEANDEVNRQRSQIAKQADEISRLRASLELMRKAKSA